MTKHYPWWLFPFVCCYDGEGEGGGDGGEGGSGSESEGGDKSAQKFTQEDVNRFLAEERRKEQKKNEKLEQQYAKLLENQNLSAVERAELEKDRDEMRAQFQTKEQKLLADKKRVESELTLKLEEATKRANSTWQMYEQETIHRSLLDAASKHEAYNPQQLTTMLRNQSKLVEEKDDNGKPTGRFAVMVELSDQDAESGSPITTTRTPDEAVKRMKELPDLYGNLFKSGVVSGLGGSSATGGMTPGSNGRLSRDQIAKLSPTQYRKIREENPELLGFTKSA